MNESVDESVNGSVNESVAYKFIWQGCGHTTETNIGNHWFNG